MTPDLHTARKIKARNFGRGAEILCRWRLRLSRYQILETNYRLKTGEIDIIARRGHILVFIEVKARQSLDVAAHAIGRRQKQRIERTAMLYMSNQPELHGHDIRFDVMLVQSLFKMVWLKDAWRPNEDGF